MTAKCEAAAEKSAVRSADGDTQVHAWLLRGALVCMHSCNREATLKTHLERGAPNTGAEAR